MIGLETLAKFKNSAVGGILIHITIPPSTVNT